MRAVDTNVLVRLITRDEAKQTEAAEKFVATGAWVAQLVLAETTWVLERVYGLSAKGIASAVEMLLSHDNLTVQDADTVSAALRAFHSKPSLGFSDCLIVEIARKAGHVPMGTFDRGLAKLDGTVRVISSSE